MLIKSLEAHNFRKYEILTVNDLPEYGLIAISGLNESGKSSIGEAIFFALFGRIFNIDEAELKKLIRWGADAASVKLTILGKGDEEYQIHRTIDESGNSEVSLTRLKDNTIVSKGNNATNEAIVKMLGYDHNTFSDSVFLVARDLSNPDPDSSSIKQMAGIGDYSKIRDELTANGAINKGSAQQIQPAIKEKKATLESLDIDENWLPELIDAREVVNTESKQKLNLSGELAEFGSVYQDKQKQHKRTRRGWRFFNLLTWLLLPLMLIAWGLWIVFNFFPDIIQKLSQYLIRVGALEQHRMCAQKPERRVLPCKMLRPGHAGCDHDLPIAQMRTAHSEEIGGPPLAQPRVLAPKLLLGNHNAALS